MEKQSSPKLLMGLSLAITEPIRPEKKRPRTQLVGFLHFYKKIISFSFYFRLDSRIGAPRKAGQERGPRQVLRYSRESLRLHDWERFDDQGSRHLHQERRRVESHTRRLFEHIRVFGQDRRQPQSCHDLKPITRLVNETILGNFCNHKFLLSVIPLYLKFHSRSNSFHSRSYFI